MIVLSATWKKEHGHWYKLFRSSFNLTPLFRIRCENRQCGLHIHRSFGTYPHSRAVTYIYSSLFPGTHIKQPPHPKALWNHPNIADLLVREMFRHTSQAEVVRWRTSSESVRCAVTRTKPKSSDYRTSWEFARRAVSSVGAGPIAATRIIISLRKHVTLWSTSGRLFHLRWTTTHTNKTYDAASLVWPSKPRNFLLRPKRPSKIINRLFLWIATQPNDFP